MANALQPLLTAAEGFRLLRISRQQGWNLRRTGELQAVIIGGRIFFERDEINRFIESRREQHVSLSDSDRVGARPLVGRSADDPCVPLTG